MLTEKQQDLIERLNPSTVGLEVLIDEIPRLDVTTVCSVDVEHNELGAFVCCGIYPAGTNRCYVIFDLALLSSVSWPHCLIVGHNVASDVELLRIWGFSVSDEQIYHDTQLYAHILDSSLPEYGLKHLAKLYCGIEYPSYDDIVGKRTKKQISERVTLDKQPQELVAKYNAFDCYATMKLYDYQITKQDKAARLYFASVEQPVAHLFREMESRGIRIDLEYLQQVLADLESKIKPIKEGLQDELGGINLDSPKQLLAALKLKGITPIYRGKESTDKRALENVKSHGVIHRLLQYRELETLLSSFVQPYLTRGTEYIRPYFNQCGTRTGRLSCSNPNLLQIPKRTDNGKLVRKMFIARDGMQLGDCDFGQIEPRVLAHLSKDPVLCDMFNKGVDFHEFTAANLGISRDRAKVLNLSVGYRATWKSVMQQLKCSQPEAQNEIDKWWSLFPTLRRYQDRLIWEARRSGVCTTLLGRRIRVDGLENTNQWKKEAAERQLINNVTQGSAAEIMKRAMLKIHENITAFSPCFGLLVQVYDELLAESTDMTKDVILMQQCMESCIALDVPLVAEGKIGFNWGELS